mmetsp:Transcript_39006/g.81640  ORF Transcript_39006/g.81640 Transcript_39006/m.81640 type:complete len:225 (+) Transcript_39006:1077-1751(+)
MPLSSYARASRASHRDISSSVNVSPPELPPPGVFQDWGKVSIPALDRMYLPHFWTSSSAVSPEAASTYSSTKRPISYPTSATTSSLIPIRRSPELLMSFVVPLSRADSYFVRAAARAFSAREVESLTDAKSMTGPPSRDTPNDNSLAIFSSAEPEPPRWTGLFACVVSLVETSSFFCGTTDIRNVSLLRWVPNIAVCGWWVNEVEGATRDHAVPDDTARAAAIA